MSCEAENFTDGSCLAGNEDVAFCRQCERFSRDGGAPCPRLVGGLAVTQGALRICCLHPRTFGLPLAEKNGGTAAIKKTLRQFFLFRTSLQDRLELGQSPTTMRNISHLSVAIEDACNLSCLYCNEISPAERRKSVHPSSSVLPIISILSKSNFLSDPLEYDIAGLEPTLSPYFDDIANILAKNGASGTIYTNATRFSRAIDEALHGDKVKIIVSLDAGTAETYRIVKQRDLFHKVINNLKIYSKNSRNVILKYVMVPQNSSYEDIDAFCGMAKSLHIEHVIIAGNIFWKKKWDSQLAAMLHLRDRLRSSGIFYSWNTLTIHMTEEEAEQRLAALRAAGSLPQ